MGEKTEKATPKKLRDARKKGQVAKSQDLPAAFTFIVSIFIVLGMSRYLYDEMGGFTVSVFELINRPDLDSLLPQLFMKSLMIIFLAAMPVLLGVAVVGILINFLAVGPVFALEVFKFDIKKFDPVQNLKAKFKMKTLVELLKSIIKISVAGWLIYGVIWSSLPVLTQSVALPTAHALMLFHHFLMEVVTKVGLFFLVVAVADFAYQKKNFAKEMKMEKFEVKQEYKNSEGNPEIKGRRRQIAQEIAFGDAPGGGVKNAQALVTNPTHLAIAIAYERGVDPAPYIVGMGEDILADRMIATAERYGIPIVRNIRLAHALWEEGEVYEFIPENVYGTVAEVMRWIEALGTEAEYVYEDD